MKKFLVTLTFCIGILFFLATNSYAEYCACCSEKGYYSISYSKLSDYQLDELKRIKFASTVNLYMDAGAEENIKGISEIADNYDLTGGFFKPKWNLTFKTANKSGVLNLPMPLKFINYKVDTHSDDSGNRADPILYKEWRFEGTATGNGIFQTGIAPMTKYFLVLQGRGNVCDNAEDFTHWRLEITGKKASYAFFGKLMTN